MYSNQDVELFNGFWDEVSVLDFNIFLCTGDFFHNTKVCV